MTYSNGQLVRIKNAAELSGKLAYVVGIATSFQPVIGSIYVLYPVDPVGEWETFCLTEACFDLCQEEVEPRRDEEIIQGLHLLKKYIPGGADSPGGWHVCAEHDVIYAGPDNSADVSAEDKERLLALNWVEDEGSNRWMIFT